MVGIIDSRVHGQGIILELEEFLHDFLERELNLPKTKPARVVTMPTIWILENSALVLFYGFENLLTSEISPDEALPPTRCYGVQLQALGERCRP